MSKGTMINEEIAVVLCFAICIAVLVFAIMFKCTGKENNTNDLRTNIEYNQL